MKITFVLPELSLSGGIRVAADYGRALMNLGHEVAFLARRSDRPNIRDILRGRARMGKEVEFLPEFFIDLGDKVKFVTSQRALLPSDLPDADFLIATWWETVEWVRHMPKEKGTVAHLMQGYEMFPWVPRDRVARTYEEDTIKIAVSEWVADQVLTHHGRRSAAVIHNAVDTNRFAYKEKHSHEVMTLGFVYSQTPIKNSNLVFDLRNILDKRGVPVRLLTFHSHRLPYKARSWARFEAHLRPTQEHIPKIYQSCDVWLFPSTEEGFGLPILEALSCGTPVIATHAGAAPQLIQHGINGYLSATDPQAFSDLVMKHMALDDAQKQRMSRAARESALGWNWARAAQKLLDTLSSSGKD